MLAILTYLIFNIVGVVKQGPIGYLKGTLFPPGAPKWVYVLLTPIEFFSVFIVRPLTLMVRLLANMMAGHILLKVFAGFVLLMGVFGVVPMAALVGITALELLVAVLQAYIFTILTCVYLHDAIHMH